VFKPMFGRLSDVAQVVYLDLAGCGRSDASPDGIHTLERWADDLVEFCDHLEIVHPAVLGNSAGGMVAAMYAIRHPQHPGKLILSSTQARLDVQRCLTMFERLGGAEARTVAEHALVTSGDLRAFQSFSERCLPLYNPTPSSRKRHPIFRRDTFVEFHQLGGTWHTLDFLDALADVRCPTMVLAGTEDPVTPVEDSEDIVAALDPAIVRFERFDNAGHGVWLDDEPRAFAVIRDFITESTPPPG
jgi:proline iminopeptidase